MIFRMGFLPSLLSSPGSLSEFFGQVGVPWLSVNFSGFVVVCEGGNTVQSCTYCVVI